MTAALELTQPLNTAFAGLTSYQATGTSSFYYEVQKRDLLIARKILMVKELIPHMIKFIEENIHLSSQNQGILRSLKDKNYSRREITKLSHDEMEFLIWLIQDAETPIEIGEAQSNDSQNQILLAERITVLDQVRQKNIFKVTQTAFKALQEWNQCLKSDRIQKAQIKWEDSSCTRGFIMIFTSVAVFLTLVLIFGEKTDAPSPPNWN